MADGARIILRDTGPILRSPLLFRRAIATMAMALLSYGHSPVPISGGIGWRACEPFGRSDMPASAAGMSSPCASGQRAHGKTTTKGDQSSMNMKKISAACATAAALAALCVPGAAFAADGTLTLNAGDGSTLAGHSFTVYKLANYNDVVKDGANVKSVSASSPDAAADAWVKAALNKNGVTYNTSEGRNAAEQLLRLQTDSNTLRKVAGTLQSTAAASKVTAVKTNQTSTTGSLNLTLPEGYYLVVDAQGIPILVSTTIGGATRMSNGQTLGSTQIKTNVTKIDKKIKSVDGTWKDSAAATNGETRDFKATFTVPNKLAVDTITLEDHMTGITYIDGSFHASVDGTDITDQFGAIGKDKITAAAGKTQTDGTGFKVTSLQSLVDTYQGKQVTVTYQGKVVNASKANKAINQIILTSNWLPSVIPPDVPTPNPGTDETPVPTYDVNLKKISAADGSKTIQGAKFKIHNDSLNQWYTWDSASNQWTFGTDESKATEFSTNAQGVINFTRLGAGTYTVKETQVPTGYFTFVKPSFTIKITDDGHVTIAGKDQPGLTGKVTNADANASTPTAVVKNIDNITQLPQTGATTMAIMIVGAFAIILVATATGWGAYRIRHENMGDGPIAA
ncbi:LPXTG cell wall anchor domain-containing protein [Bifidobacterium pseudocatenulatum]|nr:LPXTG cell wall anchor domain-containing protein [Bifidobacterium pseudocatenulatum]RGY39364.1 LPXTG cell wall anchor domain-containing protein [Bifidobacterium pseudocatenulatum]RGY40382.1 LPXTG cell wall anchor domain-containing protein [Bifidobacterium pseudocatenulatum]RGY44409.1 LPXTG cell wall anchor domain-containing protein [Bifidobacterium pseudocatenulatum]RGY60696.1 LPXTG cell wall anchor domain-containing protein [Bifidobacterium pseudocatenulatum]